MKNFALRTSVAMTLALVWCGSSAVFAQSASTRPSIRPAPKPGNGQRPVSNKLRPPSNSQRPPSSGQRPPSNGQRPPTTKPKPPATQLPSAPHHRPRSHRPPRHRPPGWSGNYYPGWRPSHWRPIHRPPYHYPNGYHYRRWTTGQVLAHAFLTSAYYFSDYGSLGLYAPPPNYRWVRYGPDLLLVDIRNGHIYDVIYGAFI